MKKETLLGWWKKLPLGKAAVLLGICGIALLCAGSLWDSSPAPQEEGESLQEDGGSAAKMALAVLCSIFCVTVVTAAVVLFVKGSL